MTHRYRIGEQVRFEANFGFKSASGSYKIVSLLPIENDDRLRYRIKSVAETFERIAEEHRLTHAD